MTIQLIQNFEKKFKSNISCSFNVGDTIRVHTKIIEGEKERVQIFTGIVVAMKGKGLSKTITIYRNAYGCSMERVFIINSPKITQIEIEKKGKVKKSKLYYLRGQSGKKAKIEEQFMAKALEGDESLEKFNVPGEALEAKAEEMEEVETPVVEAKPIEEVKENSKKKVKSEETEKKPAAKKEKKENKE